MISTTSDATLETLPQAVWIVSTLAGAGVFHVLWLNSGLSKPFLRPIDCGHQYLGKPIFGHNKTFGGLMIMPAATALLFALTCELRPVLPEWLRSGMWNSSINAYLIVGFLSGLAFMLAELPNSFVKRRLGVAPGQVATSPPLRWLFFVIDRCDSSLGALIVITALMPVTAATWLWVLLLGPAAHALFSIWLHALGIKERKL